MENKSYYVSKDKHKKQMVYFEYDKVDGYQVSPKVRKDDEIEVSKIIFVNPEFSEKIIRKKIEKKIAYLISQLKIIEDDDSGDTGTIRKSLIEAEKLRLQIINNYVKYLGHTYESLTLKKIQIIVNRLKYKLYTIKELEQERYYQNYRDNGRGR